MNAAPTNRPNNKKPGVVKQAVVLAVGVAIGFAVMTTASSQIAQMVRSGQPDMPTAQLQKSVMVDLTENEDATLTSDVECSRTSEDGIWICGYDTATGHVRLRVGWWEDGSFSYEGGLPFIPNNQN